MFVFAQPALRQMKQAALYTQTVVVGLYPRGDPRPSPEQGLVRNTKTGLTMLQMGDKQAAIDHGLY